MKKYLLSLAVAAMVALGANAQFARTTKNFKMMKPTTEVKTSLKSIMMATESQTPVITKKAQSRRAASIAGTYILESANFYGDFIENTMFTIEEEEGKTNVADFNDDDELVFDSEFEYNVVLTDFTDTGATSYGYYDAEEGYILVPMQTIKTNSTYGEVVMSSASYSDKGISYGGDIVLWVEEDGNLTFDEEFSMGWLSFLPNYEDQPYATWNYGFDAMAFLPNAVLGTVECHVSNGGWGDWESQQYDVYVEDYESEIVVHNFFGLCPISIAVNDGTAGIECPVRIMDYDFSDDEENPNYIQIWQWDENFENIIDPGEITGNVFVEEDGTKVIEFYDTEYRDAWTDEYGDHEAGDYILTDYTKWFMCHSNWGENGAYWWGEARNVYLVIPPTEPADIEGIATINDSVKDTKTFNLMGQQVNRADAKGIIIRDGKKLMVK